MNIPPPQAIFYVTRDIERALGLSPQTEGYFIISNFSEYSKKIAFGQENILLIDEGRILDTWELLNHPKTTEFISHQFPPLVGEGQGGVSPTAKKPHIVVFKNTSVIEKICQEKGYNLLNPPATLSQKVEEKISQIEWLQELSSLLPPHEVKKAAEISFDGTPFILQFNRAHTGLGTMFISSQDQLTEIQQKFPHRPVKRVEFIVGPMFTSNNVVTKNNVLVGNISYQITGLAPFTQNPFATIGNDFALPHKILSPELLKIYYTMTTDIGNRLRESGWKGLFGIDVIYDTEKNELYLIEINARQPASTTFESQLQESKKAPARNASRLSRDAGGKKQENNVMTTFEAHLNALFDVDTSGDELIQIFDGAQIIQRVISQTQQNKQLEQIEQLEQLEQTTIIPYENTDPGSDFIRIQIPTGIMQNHGEFNETGLKIAQILDFKKI